MAGLARQPARRRLTGMTPVKERIHRRLALEGHVTVAALMEEALAGDGGYYRDRDPLGAEGDFLTAPEISQMFGELVGLWCVDTWQRLGSPERIQLVEIGPGRGTLMADALRAARVAPGFLAAKELNLIEISATLRQRQGAALADHAPRWRDGVGDLPPGPVILVANELFDALPVHQFEMTQAGWRERVVTAAAGSLKFALAAPGAALALLRPAHRDARNGEVAEVSPAALRLMDAIAGRIAGAGGAALIIDYGPTASAPGDSLQAMKSHAFHDPLSTLGEADLTAHVDFEALATVARQRGAATFGPVSQGDFLRALGLDLRTEMLAEKSDPQTAAILRRQRDRLIAPEQMGRLFKVLGLGGDGIDRLAGL